ncbi:hypothetical protein N7507_007072, partial [Penicillium longicatenatum]
AERRPALTFSQQTWEQKILNLITVSYLPFLFVEHQEFYDLFSYARLAPTLPSVPSRKVIRDRLRVPYLTHVIQLSLVDLLGKIKASPKNDNAKTEWSDDRVRLLHTR